MDVSGWTNDLNTLSFSISSSQTGPFLTSSSERLQAWACILLHADPLWLFSALTSTSLSPAETLDEESRWEDCLLVHFAFIKIEEKKKKWCQTPAYKSDRKGSDKDTVFFFYLMGSDIQCVDKRLKPLYCTLYHEMTRWRRAEYLFTKLQSWADKITWTPYSTTEASWRRF